MDIPKKFVYVQIILVTLVLASFSLTLIFVKNPSDYLPDKISLSDRKGTINGYTFLDWKHLMPNELLAAEYMDLAAQSLNCCYVNCQWSKAGLTNDSLDIEYLDNLSLYIEGMAERGVKTIIYTWVSAYSPQWMFAFTPELEDLETGKAKTCWYGMDPNSEDPIVIQHRNSLKWSMLHFYEQLSQYFIDKELDENITGWNLDDETNIDPEATDGESYWNDFFTDITTLIHSKDADWEVQAMWLASNTYHIAGIADFDVNAFDAYCQDAEMVQRITYSYQISGCEKASVMLSAMYMPEDTISRLQMQRHAWVCWFMGVDSIGWYSFYYGSMEDDSWTCAELHYEDDPPTGPERTIKTDATEQIASDYYKLNQIWEKIESKGLASEAGRLMEKRLLKAYDYAKASMFNQARAILTELMQE
jgi:hypothetical protein